jgi:acyl-CoA thioester hydrolase
MIHRFPVHVYYEDTDLAGIVYYANYLRYIERARTEMVREMGVDQVSLKAEHGVVFAVRRVEADYIAPARFDDDLIVETHITNLTGARVVMQQDVRRSDALLFQASVTIVALSEDGQPTRLPAAFKQRVN